MAREINRGRDEGLDTSTGHQTLLELADVLGLTLRKPKHYEIDIAAVIVLAAKCDVNIKEPRDARSIIELLSNKRAELRRAKNWQLADRIRNGLKELGVTLEDTPQGTLLRYKKP